jgi:hypothetical protein
LEAIPQLTAAGISYYDPQVKEWSSKLVALEGLMKAWCKILLFVIGSRTRALASMIEVAALIAAGRRVVLVIENVEAGVEIEGQVPSGPELKDLNRARQYLRDVANNYHIPVHPSTDHGIKALIAAEEEERRESRARLQLMRDAAGSRGSISSASGAGGAAASASALRRQRSSISHNQNMQLHSPSHALSLLHRKNTHSASLSTGSHAAATAQAQALQSHALLHQNSLPIGFSSPSSSQPQHHPHHVHAQSSPSPPTMPPARSKPTDSCTEALMRASQQQLQIPNMHASLPGSPINTPVHTPLPSGSNKKKSNRQS